MTREHQRRDPAATEGAERYNEATDDLAPVDVEGTIEEGFRLLGAANPAEDAGDEGPDPETWGGTSADAPAPPG